MKRSTALQRRIDQLLAAARDAHRDPSRLPPHLDGELLFAYWESALDPASRDAVEEHALACEACLRWLLDVGRLFEKR
jgi:hypothetical protein